MYHSTSRCCGNFSAKESPHEKSQFYSQRCICRICDCHHRHLDGISSQQSWSPRAWDVSHTYCQPHPCLIPDACTSYSSHAEGKRHRNRFEKQECAECLHHHGWAHCLYCVVAHDWIHRNNLHHARTVSQMVWKTSLVEMHTYQPDIHHCHLLAFWFSTECTDALWASNLGKGGNHVT